MLSSNASETSFYLMPPTIFVTFLRYLEYVFKWQWAQCPRTALIISWFSSDRITSISLLHMCVSTMSMYSPEIVVIFLRQNYKHIIASHVCEHNVHVQPWNSRDFPQIELPVYHCFTCVWAECPCTALKFSWCSSDRITSISLLQMCEGRMSIYSPRILVILLR
jgi:hypothetical protein